MKHDAEFDKMMAGLAKHFASCADTLLDLRGWVADPQYAGSCIKAYFELLGEAPEHPEIGARLRDLREWLERRFKIVVLDAGKSVCIETLPLALEDGTDLPSFCHRKMSLVRNDRCHEAREIRLEFSFQGGAEPPAVQRYA